MKEQMGKTLRKDEIANATDEAQPVLPIRGGRNSGSIQGRGMRHKHKGKAIL